MSDSVTYLS